MAQHHAPPRPRLLALALTALLGLSVLPSPAPAQATDGTHYTNSATFEVPFQLDEAGGRVRQLLLHVSDDLGKTYQHAATAAATDKKFNFTAKRDGWYWFVLQSEDKDGRLAPANLATAQPGLKVCVDTVKPQIVAFKPVVPGEGNVAVEWEVRDENLDRFSLQLDYRPANGRDWVPLPVEKLARGHLPWTSAFNGPCEVRLRIADKARNTAEAITTVTPSAAGAPGPAPSSAKRGQIIHVRSLDIQLNYKIGNVGPSMVKNVEVWETRDTRGWRRVADDAPATGPYTIHVKSEGRYGYTLIPRSGVGLARPAPQVGEPPQVWVEVDQTRPTVNLYRVDVGRGPDAGKMTVYWTASDLRLRARPIAILYATTAEGPWTELPGVGKLPNVSPYTASSQGLPFEFYLRVEAYDEAGNMGFSVTRETVKVDLKVPVVDDLQVTGADPVTPVAPPAPPASPGG